MRESPSAGEGGTKSGGDSIATSASVGSSTGCRGVRRGCCRRLGLALIVPPFGYRQPRKLTVSQIVLRLHRMLLVSIAVFIHPHPPRHQLMQHRLEQRLQRRFALLLGLDLAVHR